MENNELLFVTHNSNKLKEARALVQGSPFELITLDMVPELVQIDDIPETGSTFEENAQQKVDFILARKKMSAFAEDSGLVVPSLDGLPGVQSKRWFAGSDADRNTQLLTMLEGQSDRKAYFIAVICLYEEPKDNYQFFTGTVWGNIAEQPSGEAGFGYDPIFVPDGYDQTFALLGAEVKHEVSHRARAFQALASYLRDSSV